MEDDAVKCGGTARENQVLGTSIISVNQVNPTMESLQVWKHERGDQVSAVNQNFCSSLIGTVDGTNKVWNMVMAV